MSKNVQTKKFIVVLIVMMVSSISYVQFVYSDDLNSLGSKDVKTEITTIIDEAISVGAPTYNSGNYVGCYRIYEGASYKILYLYGSKCKDERKILKEALEKSYGDYSFSEKAWIMRMAFDRILGVPTITK
jgi:hypothetical protein